MTQQTPPEKPSAALRAVAGLTPFVVMGLVCVVSFVVAGPGDVAQAARESGIALWLVSLAALVSAIAAGVLIALAPGVRVPAAIPLAVGTWPWLAGLAGASWGAAQVESAIAFADPASRAMLLAQGLSEALLGRVIGGVVGAGVLAGVALAMAIASVAPRAPNRSGLGAMGGLVAGGVPILAGLAFAVLGGGAGGAALLAGVGTLGAIACAIAGWGAGADAPHARAASLAAATPVAVLLALACAGGAASTLPIIAVFGAIAAADPASRIELLASFGDEIEVPSALAAYAWGFALLACAVLTGWAASRARPTGGRLLAAGAVVVVMIATLLLGQGAQRATFGMLAASAPAPWAPIDGFEPVLLRGGAGSGPAILVGVDRVATPDGRSVPLAGIEAPGPAREQVAALIRGALGPDAPEPQAGSILAGRPLESPLVPIAIDARVPGSVLRALVAIADEAGARSIELVGVGSRTPPETLARVPEELRGIAGSADVRSDVALVPRSVASFAASDPRLLHARIVPAHESTAVTLEARPGAAGDTIPARVDAPAWDRPTPDDVVIYLTIDPATPASTVASVVSRVRALGHTPVLLATDEVPGNPSQPAAGEGGFGLGPEWGQAGVLGALGGGGTETIGLGSIGTISRGSGTPSTTGDGSGRIGGPTIGADAPSVLGSLSSDVIRRVVRRHLPEIRLCYEQGLARAPSLSGTVVMRWTIAADGGVREVAVQSSTLRDPSVESCMTRAVGTWAFPAPEGGGIVRVDYPFALAASP